MGINVCVYLDTTVSRSRSRYYAQQARRHIGFEADLGHVGLNCSGSKDDVEKPPRAFPDRVGSHNAYKENIREGRESLPNICQHIDARYVRYNNHA